MSMDDPKPATKPKNTIFKLLRKAASALIFHNLLFNPIRRDKKKPIVFVSIIPEEARRKPRNSSFEIPEPISPKISCIGQIEHRKKSRKAKTNPKPEPKPTTQSLPPPNSNSTTVLTKPESGRVENEDHLSHDQQKMVPDRGTCMSQIKCFESLVKFDYCASSSSSR